MNYLLYFVVYVISPLCGFQAQQIVSSSTDFPDHLAKLSSSRDLLNKSPLTYLPLAAHCSALQLIVSFISPKSIAQQQQCYLFIVSGRVNHHNNPNTNQWTCNAIISTHACMQPLSEAPPPVLHYRHSRYSRCGQINAYLLHPRNLSHFNIDLDTHLGVLAMH